MSLILKNNIFDRSSLLEYSAQILEKSDRFEVRVPTVPKYNSLSILFLLLLIIESLTMEWKKVAQNKFYTEAKTVPSGDL